MIFVGSLFCCYVYFPHNLWIFTSYCQWYSRVLCLRCILNYFTLKLSCYMILNSGALLPDGTQLYYWLCTIINSWIFQHHLKFYRNMYIYFKFSIVYLSQDIKIIHIYEIHVHVYNFHWKFFFWLWVYIFVTKFTILQESFLLLIFSFFVLVIINFQSN